MTTFSKRLFIVNSLGAFGYMSNALQWLWTLIVIGYPLITSDFSWFFPADTTRFEASPIDIGAPSVVTIGLTVVVTLVMIAITIYCIVMLPKTIGQIGARATHKAATLIMPSITGKKPVSNKRRLQLSYRIIALAKLTTCLIPLLIVVVVPPSVPLANDIVIITALFCAVSTGVYFVLQMILVRLLRLQKSQVW